MSKDWSFGNKNKRYLSKVPKKNKCLKNLNLKNSETPTNNYEQVINIK
jgi:hypothetical protein